MNIPSRDYVDPDQRMSEQDRIQELLCLARGGMTRSTHLNHTDRCPVCAGDSIVLDNTIIDTTTANGYEGLRCGDCGASWVLAYDVTCTGYTALRFNNDK